MEEDIMKSKHVKIMLTVMLLSVCLASIVKKAWAENYGGKNPKGTDLSLQEVLAPSRTLFVLVR